MRVLLTTNIRLLKSFNFLTHSLKVYCEARKDPRAKFVDEPGSTTGSGSCMISSNGSGQLRRTLPSLSTVKDITTHDSSDNGAHTMRNRQEIGEAKNTTVPPIDHKKNLVEDITHLTEHMMAYELNYDGIEILILKEILLTSWKLRSRTISLKFWPNQARSSLSHTSPFLT